MSDLEIAEVTFISIPGYAAHPSELGRIGPDGQWIPNGAVEYLVKGVERLTAERDALKKALSYLLEHQLYINSHAKAVIKCALEKLK